MVLPDAQLSALGQNSVVQSRPHDGDETGEEQGECHRRVYCGARSSTGQRDRGHGGRFVFESREGKPLVYGTFYSARFRPAVGRLVAAEKLPPEKAGLRFHDLRHTCAALMINLAEANPLSVKNRMGHSTITVTYDRYGHLFPQNEEEIIAGLDAIGRVAQSVAG